jgi:VWFA-related protein
MHKAKTKRRLQIGIILIICSCSLLFSDNEKKKSANSSEDATFRVPVNAVMLMATVLDKKGNPITDLKAEDFRIYDDGKLQPIQTFSTESYDYEQSEKTEPASQGESKLQKAISPQSEMKPRLISLIIDDLTMQSSAWFPLIQTYIRKYVESNLGKYDQIALLSASGKAVIPFTNNKEEFLNSLSAAFKKINYLPADRTTCKGSIDNPTSNDPTSQTGNFDDWSLSDYQAFQIDTDHYMIGAYNGIIPAVKTCLNNRILGSGNNASSGSGNNPNSPPSGMESITDDMAKSYLRAMASIQNANVQNRTYNLLSLIKQHLRILRRYDGNKSVVLFSDGILAERSTPAEHKVQEIIDLAIRSEITFNIINQSGVQFLRNAEQAFDNQARESTLQQIAHDTGGIYHNDNDMLEGLRRAIKKQSFQYILSYGMPSGRPPGTYHKINVETTRSNVQISCRKGYYIGKEALSIQNTKKEDILSAMYAPADLNEIPTVLSYSYLIEDDGSYSMSFITSADIRKMQFTKENDRQKNIMHIVLAAFDENDRYVNAWRHVFHAS